MQHGPNCEQQLQDGFQSTYNVHVVESVATTTTSSLVFVITRRNWLINPLGTHQNREAADHYTAIIGTLAIDVTFGTASRGLGRLWPRPVPSLLYQL